MASRSPYKGRTGMVIVRLSQIPPERRAKAANQVIQNEHLRGIEALEVRLAAERPREDPYRLVTREQAKQVMT